MKEQTVVAVEEIGGGKVLVWDVDAFPPLDVGLNFSMGYDYFGLENLSQGAKGPNGRYRIWPNRSHTGQNWSLYRDTDGAFAFEKYPSEQECKDAAELWCKEEMA